MTNPTQDDYRYAAGFLDGEGTIRISSCKSKPTSFSLKVQAVNTNKEVLDWFKEKFNGAVRLRYKGSKKEKRKACWVWEVTCQRAEVFLQNTVLFLKVKQPQAKLCLEYREHVNNYPSRGRLSKREIFLRNNYKKRVSKLNQGGVYDDVG